jgi:hypothetical protein
MTGQKKDYSTMTAAQLAKEDAEMEAEYAKAVAATKQAGKLRRQKFQATFVIFPMRWVDVLESANTDRSTYRLAIRLLVAAYEREHRGGEIVLSSEVTRMPRNSKYRAARKLEALGLIRIEPRGLKQSPVIHVLATQPKRKAPACSEVKNAVPRK